MNHDPIYNQKTKKTWDEWSCPVHFKQSCTVGLIRSFPNFFRRLGQLMALQIFPKWPKNSSGGENMKSYEICLERLVHVWSSSKIFQNINVYESVSSLNHNGAKLLSQSYWTTRTISPLDSISICLSSHNNIAEIIIWPLPTFLRNKTSISFFMCFCWLFVGPPTQPNKHPSILPEKLSIIWISSRIYPR